MDERDVEAVVIPPQESGLLLLTGAAELVTDAILDLELEIDYLQREVSQDGAGVTCVRVDPEDESLDEVQRRIWSALEELIASTPELAGWTPRVRLGEASHDHDEHVPELDDIEALAEHLLPSGDEIVESLMRDIQHERSVYADSQLFRAFPVEELATEDSGTLDPKERATAHRRASALAGCLIQASVILVDQLIDDVAELRKHEGTADERIGKTWVFSDLPARFATNYTALFAQEFLVAFVDVTSRLTRGWEPLACVAQELGVRVLLDHVEVVAEAADVALPEDWRGHLEDLLFEDMDHELLYDPAHDGIEEDPAGQPPGMAPMRFVDWFRPFNDRRTLPPYALPAPPSTDAMP
ncbi:MAG: hypothetical protein ACR2MP_26500 [Streptosporangiaceae bacterium]